MAHVLVVDDNPDNIRLLALELGRQGHQVISAHSGLEALEKVACERPDLVLLDVVMPDLSGLEVCRRLKADEQLRSIPVVMVTVRGSHDDVLAGLEAGADDYISRPFDRRVLTARLQAALRTKDDCDAVREMNQRLDEARRMAELSSAAKSEFLASMSHEIRTPMTAILGFADLLRDNLSDANDLEAVDTIKRNGEYLLEIINDLLDLSKIEAGRFMVDIGPCAPRQVLADVLALMRLRSDAKGLSLDMVVKGQVPEIIQCDALRLRQILVNLVGNAIKFTENGNVRIVLRLLEPPSGGPLLQFDVVDTGIGMSAEQIRALFYPFSQTDSSVTRRFGGTGLGLTISKRLAELLGGDITVTSVPGIGSTFSLTVAAG
ncbi:MAG: response regulator [Pirellulales bacterium]